MFEIYFFEYFVSVLILRVFRNIFKIYSFKFDKNRYRKYVVLIMGKNLIGVRGIRIEFIFFFNLLMFLIFLYKKIILINIIYILLWFYYLIVCKKCLVINYIY